MMSLQQKIGRHIYELRNKEGFSREDFADLANISLNSLASIENGKSLVKLDTLQEILGVLSLSLNSFFADLSL